MEAMQAVAKTARGEVPLALREIPTPQPGPGQVLLAVRAIDISEEEPAPAVGELTGGWEADIVFECSGPVPPRSACWGTPGAAGSTLRSGSSGGQSPGSSTRSA